MKLACHPSTAVHPAPTTDPATPRRAPAARCGRRTASGTILVTAFITGQQLNNLLTNARQISAQLG